jgi:hypothetical protein
MTESFLSARAAEIIERFMRQQVNGLRHFQKESLEARRLRVKRTRFQQLALLLKPVSDKRRDSWR